MAHRILSQARRTTSLRYRPKPIVIILSASPQDSNSKTLLAFKKLKDFRTEMFFISFGQPVPKDKYKSIFPNPYYYLAVKSPSELENHLEEFVQSKGTSMNTLFIVRLLAKTGAT